jgi:hypothetical protein
MTFDVDTLNVTETHKAFAAFIKRESGKQVSAQSLALADALRSAFRNDPARVAERERVKEEARKRKQAAFEKQAEKMKRLAAELGLDVVIQGTSVHVVTPDREEVPEPVNPDDFGDYAGEGESFDAPEPEVVPAPKAPRKPRQRRAPEPEPEPERPALSVVKDVDPLTATPADDVPLSSDIDVMESEDGWAKVSDEADTDDVEDW